MVSVNCLKCEVLWPSGDQSFPEFPPEVQRVGHTKGGAEFLGCTIYGSNNFFTSSLSKCIDNVLDCQDRLSDLEYPQVELHLLCSCISLCKINHLLRMVPPEVTLPHLLRFDRGYGIV